MHEDMVLCGVITLEKVGTFRIKESNIIGDMGAYEKEGYGLKSISVLYIAIILRTHSTIGESNAPIKTLNGDKTPLCG